MESWINLASCETLAQSRPPHWDSIFREEEGLGQVTGKLLLNLPFATF